MAWEFANRNVATVKIDDATAGNKTYSFAGTTTDNITPEFAATQINKILDIGGLSATVTANMTRTQVEEAVDNG